MIETYLILSRKKYNEPCKPIKELDGMKKSIIKQALELHNNERMNRTLVVDENLSIIFKVERKCKCASIQYEINGKGYCINCGDEVLVWKEIANGTRC